MPDTEFPTDKRSVYTVSRFNAEVRQLLLDRFKPIWLEGEISNLSRPASGHIYFSLKDDAAQIRCAMFRGRNHALGFEPESGMQVMVHARADLYEVRGEFQLIVNFMEIAGHGELRRRFEQLKLKLAKEGLFEQARKRPIPRFPRRVGVVTSDNGAALHDILTTLGSRFPAIETVVYPTPVQGGEAPASICRMLEVANARREVDVLIVARGGGSLEDLWAFNEEQVARAIAASDLPVITGIGHEVDFTISDFVADERAPTPTAAAQRVSPNRHALAQTLTDFRRRLESRLKHRLETAGQALALRQSQLLRFHPAAQIEQWMQRMDETAERLRLVMRELTRAAGQRLVLLQTTLLHRMPLPRVHAARVRLGSAADTLGLAANHALAERRHRLQRLAARLHALSPLATLQRGYSITTDEQGRIVRSIGALAAGQKIEVRVEDGRIEAAVNELRRER